MHLKNCVEDSSALLVCTCQTYARLFPHLGHSILITGSVLSFCSFLPMTIMRSSGSISVILLAGDGINVSTCFSYPHFGHVRDNSFEFFLRLSINLVPHFGQNSIKSFSSHIRFVLNPLLQRRLLNFPLQIPFIRVLGQFL